MQAASLLRVALPWRARVQARARWSDPGGGRPLGIGVSGRVCRRYKRAVWRDAVVGRPGMWGSSGKLCPFLSVLL